MQERRPRPRNPRWAEEELVLALDLYVRSGLLDDTDPAVVELSRVLNALEIHSERPDADRFRNPNGVALKLANFAALDDNYHGRGMTSYSKLDAEVWHRYESRRDALAADASAIREGRELPAVPPVGPARAQVAAVTVEAQHVERFRFSIPDRVIEATRSEQSLVLAFTAHLESQGHMVTRHWYHPTGPVSPIVCDLVDETDHVLYEAKGNVERPSVRMAIGQLLDYCRFESTPPRLAVLLPQEPARDLIELIHSVDASVVWRTGDGFEREEPPR